MRDARAAEEALGKLIRQIEAGDYRDGHGQRLTLNTAFLEAKALVELNAVLEHREG